MSSSRYVLVTPVRNEQGTIGITIESVIRQTVLPAEWVIVSDESTDDTDAIVSRYAAKHGFIRLVRLTNRPKRNFGSVVFATEAGLAALQCRDYMFIGLLDADVRFAADYYEQIMGKFAIEPQLGLAGGLVVDFYDGQYHPSRQAMTEIAGAVQFFRRECFEALGGLIAVPEGGWDTITCVQARRYGFTTRTFSDLVVDHLKPRNIAEGNICRRNLQLGLRDQAMGNHPLFELVKCVYRFTDRPYFVAGMLRWIGYLWGKVQRRERYLAPELVAYIRKEQIARIFRRGNTQ